MAERRGRMSERITSLIRWLLVSALVCAALVVVARHLVVSRLDEQIRRHVEATLSAHYKGMDVRIQSARRVSGKGIELRGLSISSNLEDSGYRELIHIDDLLLACDVELSDLVLGRPSVRQLVIRRARIQGTRHADGIWNLSKLLPLPSSGGRLPSVFVEDSTIELRDLSKPGGSVWALRDITVQLAAHARTDGTQYLSLSGTMLGDHFKRVQVEGQIDPKSTCWSVRGTIDGLEMSPRLVGSLPAEAIELFSHVNTLRTRAHISFEVSHQPNRPEPIQWAMQGRLSEGRIDDPRLPYPLTGIVADIFCDNDRLSIENATAHSGPSLVRMSCRCEKYRTTDLRATASLSVEGLSLDHRFYEVLPKEMKASWEKFDPSGVVDATLEVTVENGQFKPDLRVVCRDVDFAYHLFPYRLRHAQGTIIYRNDQVRLEQFTAQASRRKVRFAGQFQHPGPTATGWMTVDAKGPVPIDENLIAAMKPESQRVMRALDPAGAITNIHGRFERTRPDQPPSTDLTVDLESFSIQFDRFPYPIQKISGKVILKDHRWEFRNLRGYHGSAYIVATGQWQPAAANRQGGQLVMSFRCSDVPLDDALRDAVGTTNARAKDFWKGLQPRGSVDYLGATVLYDAATHQTSLEVRAEKWPPEKNIAGRSISLHPAWLPLRMNDLTGSVRYADGRFELQRLTAKHADSIIELTGRGNVMRDGRWDVTLTQLIADRVHLDDETIDALPEAMRPALRELRFRGPLNLNGTMWLRGGLGPAITSGWDILVDIENGHIDNQLALEHIYGGLRLFGSSGPRGFVTRGNLDVDSLICRGVQVTRIKGPLKIDMRQLVVGSRAEANQHNRPPRQVTAKLWGGSATLDAIMLLGDQRRFAADVTMSQGDIQQIARMTQGRDADVSGKVFGTLHLTGTDAGIHTYRGSGKARLVDADIYKLPVMVAMLGVLSGHQPDTTAFTKADIDYRLNGDQIYFDRIDFTGDAISLKGNGWMDFNRQLNLSFYALVGRQDFQIPLVSSLLAEASRNILAIQVLGTVDQPKVVRKALPELDDTLKRVFPELTPATPGAPRGLPSVGRKSSFRGLLVR